MNYQRIAELAIAIVQNYKNDHLEFNGKQYVFDMRNYFNSSGALPLSERCSCATACCAAGYAVMMWREDKHENVFQTRDVVMSILDITKYSEYEAVYNALFAMRYEDCPHQFAARAYGFLKEKMPDFPNYRDKFKCLKAIAYPNEKSK